MADDPKIVTVHVEGLAELEESLLAGGPRVAKTFLRRVQLKVGRPLKVHLSEEAPYESGALSEDIHMMTITTDGAMTLRIGPSKRTFWGMIQEFGAAEANVPAQHWAELTAVRYQDETLENYFKALEESLKEIKI